MHQKTISMEVERRAEKGDQRGKEKDGKIERGQKKKYTEIRKGKEN